MRVGRLRRRYDTLTHPPAMRRGSEDEPLNVRSYAVEMLMPGDQYALDDAHVHLVGVPQRSILVIVGVVGIFGDGVRMFPRILRRDGRQGRGEKGNGEEEGEVRGMERVGGEEGTGMERVSGRGGVCGEER